ncbi:hypothetical protein TNCV_1944691 [Trichonephila clavipes]|nr:hypothetical protein TNCV_1944691 [Trichonephila clavipes]
MKTSCSLPTTPKTLKELERALLEEWDRIPQLVITSLIDSMPQRSIKYTKLIWELNTGVSHQTDQRLYTSAFEHQGSQGHLK